MNFKGSKTVIVRCLDFGPETRSPWIACKSVRYADMLTVSPQERKGMKQSLLEITTIAAIIVTTGFQATAATFAQDVEFLRRHTDLVVLSDKSGAAQVAVAPAWQGRVMTTTAHYV